MRIAVVTPIPTPYRDAFWNYFAQHENVSLHILYCAASKADRPWKLDWNMDYPFSFLKGCNLISWKAKESSIYFNPGVISSLRRIQPEILLIGGYNHITMWLAMIWAYIKGIPFVLMSETKKRNRSIKKAPLLKRPLLRWIAKHSSGALPTGNLAERYLLEQGWKQETLYRFPNVPDIAQLKSSVLNLRLETEALNKKWQLNGEKIVLFIGRLIKKKHVDTIIDAYAEINVSVPCKLIIIGDGNQSEQLKNQCDRLQLADHVRFLGFLEPHEILEWLAISDIFALASNETWGVAPIEAAAAGKYLLLSNDIGSANELNALYPRTTVISDRSPKNWAKAMDSCLRKITLENQEIDDNTRMDHWHFQVLAKGLHEHLKPLVK